jgi:general secretion pathway protein C
MKSLSSENFVNIGINLLFLVAFAKLIALFASWFLPQNGVEMKSISFAQIPYVRVDFHNLIRDNSDTRGYKREEKGDAVAIDNMLLVGLYGNETSGFAVVATQADPKKTTIIALGEQYKGYTLYKIFLNYVIFRKNATKYILQLQKIKTANTKESFIHTVKRKDINFYIKNPTKIWRDIAIVELKRDGKIDGFRVRKIRKNSKFAQFGLRSGDVIVEANGKRLCSYKDVMQLYENIDNIDTVALKVQRGNQEKEIVYEIY